MLKVAINLEGKTSDDLIIALQQIMRLIRDGFTSGFDSNDDGSYNFNILEGEE